MYKHLTEYLQDNELFDYVDDVKNDVRNDYVIMMIIDCFDDEIMLHDLTTSILYDMFTYYVKHK